jgi:hypothetical protein
MPRHSTHGGSRTRVYSQFVKQRKVAGDNGNLFDEQCVSRGLILPGQQTRQIKSNNPFKEVG